MIPPDYSNYFVTMATVAATLFGLIFLVVSITPENISGEGASLERQLKAAAAYLALSNPLIVSLFALLPHQEIGPAVIAVAAAGLLQVFGMLPRLLRHPAQRPFLPHNSLFLLAGLVLYGLELQDGVRLLQPTADNAVLYGLGTILIFVLIYGVARAWELVGGRTFRILDLLSWRAARPPDEPPAQKDESDTGKPP